ncbi:hypothetical protein EYF80_051237 [Liparis tanakae]|uniref:Uncharacterized protein n=1 Tax=Liparis tanakae TaxID=230148 RepID=A0A4Z2FCW1_9TELE|nr:hypothetical protein EYF80_051237 [Liparis tanakae]
MSRSLRAAGRAARFRSVSVAIGRLSGIDQSRHSGLWLPAKRPERSALGSSDLEEEVEPPAALGRVNRLADSALVACRPPWGTVLDPAAALHTFHHCHPNQFQRGRKTNILSSERLGPRGLQGPEASRAQRSPGPGQGSPGPEQGLLVQDGGLLVQDGGLLVQDGGLLVQDGGLLVQDGGLLVQDGGLLVQDGGLL